MNEISRVQEQLIASFPQLQAIMGEDPNSWGNVALNFGSGAVVVANPLVGVPLLIYRWMNESKKGDMNSAFLKNWWDRFSELCSRWDRVGTSYQPVYAAQCQFIEEKISNITETVIPRILTDLDTDGFNLKQVPASYRQFLETTKQQLGIN